MRSPTIMMITTVAIIKAQHPHVVRKDNYYKLFTCPGPAPAFQHGMHSRKLKKAQTSNHFGIG